MKDLGWWGEEGERDKKKERSFHSNKKPQTLLSPLTFSET